MTYYLIKNVNGFEEPLCSGTLPELEKARIEYEEETLRRRNTPHDQAWERTAYYIVPKREWDLEHCPLMPVDYS